MKFFPNQLYVAFNDKAEKKAPLTFDKFDSEKFTELNAQSWGIYFTPNSFDATPEEIKKLSEEKGYTVTKRNTQFLKRINAIFGDLDVSKSEYNELQEEIEAKKENFIKKLNDYCPPSVIVKTRNGIQPIWYIYKDKIDEPTLELGRQITEGLIDWSKKNGALGDEVKDVTRVIRLPGYYHHKKEPYMVTLVEGSNREWKLEELKNFFFREPKKEVYLPQRDEESPSEIDKLDMKEVVIAVWKEKRHEAIFDKDNHLIIDGKETATFVNREGKNFVATSSSDYPAKGNAVTYVAETLGISTKEAYKWLLNKFNIEHTLKKSFRKNQKQGMHEIAQYLVKKHYIRTVGQKKRELYLYSDGVYTLAGENIIRSEIQEILGDLSSNHVKNEVVTKVMDMTYSDRSGFEVDIRFVNLKNGILDLKENKLLPHSPEFRFLFQLPVSFDPDADCPAIKKFFSEMLPNEEHSKLLQEFFGYTLERDYGHRKCLVMVGDGANGKTTSINLQKAMLGEKNISGVSLHQIVGDKFAIANLYQKLANIYDDLSNRDVRDVGTFKILTGNGPVTGEYKFGEQFIFRNFAKIIFACNQIPPLKDAAGGDDAFYGRWLIIPFNVTIEKERRDPKLLEKLTTDSELSGLLNWSLQGLQRLKEHGSFTYAPDDDENRELMQKSGSPVAAFAYDLLSEGEGSEDWIAKEQMHEIYVKYIHQHKLPFLTIEELGKKLRKYATYIGDGRPQKEGKRVNAWMNVRLKEGIRDAEESATIECESGQVQALPQSRVRK